MKESNTLNLSQILKENQSKGLPIGIDSLYEKIGVNVDSRIIDKKMIHAEFSLESGITISSLIFNDPYYNYLKAYVLYFALKGIEKDVDLTQLYKNPFSDPIEYQANCFAEMVIMPKKLVLSTVQDVFNKWKRVNKHKFFLLQEKKMSNDYLIKTMSNIFSVNEDIIKSRLIQLDVLKNDSRS